MIKLTVFNTAWELETFCQLKGLTAADIVTILYIENGCSKYQLFWEDKLC